MGIRQLIYISELTAATRPDDVLADIHASSLRNNAQRQVSGCLLYSKGHFLQLLEGPEQSIEQLFGIISSDGRHVRVRVLHDAPAHDRLFEGWEMRAYNLDSHADLPREFVSRVLDWIELHDANPVFLLRILDDFKNYL